MIKLINRKISTSEVKNVKITWFGGEPLLYRNYIFNITRNLISKDNLTAQLYSNGYLLDNDFIESLQELRIKHIKIPIDGPKDIHDKRRILVNGKGSYEELIKNLELLTTYNKYANIAITTVLDNENVKYYPKLIEELECFQGKIYMDFSFTKSFDDSDKKILNEDEINYYTIKYYTLLSKKKMRVENEP